jgi:uncharacterized protein (DUF885 family)
MTLTSFPGNPCSSAGRTPRPLHLGLREEARRRWGAGYLHARFHEALLGLGSPPLGLMARALDAR